MLTTRNFGFHFMSRACSCHCAKAPASRNVQTGQDARSRDKHGAKPQRMISCCEQLNAAPHRADVDDPRLGRYRGWFRLVAHQPPRNSHRPNHKHVSRPSNISTTSRLDSQRIATAHHYPSKLRNRQQPSRCRGQVGRRDHPAPHGGVADQVTGFKKNVNRATTQVMMKTGMSGLLRGCRRRNKTDISGRPC
jgi:hypothetical protein